MNAGWQRFKQASRAEQAIVGLRIVVGVSGLILGASLMPDPSVSAASSAWADLFLASPWSALPMALLAIGVSCVLGLFLRISLIAWAILALGLALTPLGLSSNWSGLAIAGLMLAMAGVLWWADAGCLFGLDGWWHTRRQSRISGGRSAFKAKRSKTLSSVQASLNATSQPSSSDKADPPRKKPGGGGRLKKSSRNKPF